MEPTVTTLTDLDKDPIRLIGTENTLAIAIEDGCGGFREAACFDREQVKELVRLLNNWTDNYDGTMSER